MKSLSGVSYSDSISMGRGCAIKALSFSPKILVDPRSKKGNLFASFFATQPSFRWSRTKKLDSS
ncbi:hypothetical protein IEQ34_023296 [Dendrobium chrysotoxum]|uniref:Uncharacterized protein n=1 Tax=Dendrobium chrysotoxum TaxID=161865 RepID=A0AAV7FNP0_DENCH|nr:hypothetical protein IEQ34_025960 [Dendrobium chrysotoxum]KAH0446324.1 hypothetical protein IEQ34_024847 [Dendrobium chrysotoxum]KAH0446349.1 hypothetical protein IEQ34_024820 [Dendrobium chrysotoxum]KAH0446452.1 hypothetical protein IEQ34_024710 [Dendrobium chrysotoxum]KAH0446709.1 hypothetical protein IEQ34_024460 [Dendrobium chrysotoxum]